METDKRYLALAWIGVVSLIVLLFSVRITPASDLGDDRTTRESAIQDKQ